jgi:uncharacterized membrane protein
LFLKNDKYTRHNVKVELHIPYMNFKQYKQARVFIALFISVIVSISVTQNSYILATLGVLTGMLFLTATRKKTQITVDEREMALREKAAQMTYRIFAPTIGLGSFFLIMFSRVDNASKYPYLFALGQVLAYLTLFLIALYSISYHFLSRKYGGRDEE